MSTEKIYRAKIIEIGNSQLEERFRILYLPEPMIGRLIKGDNQLVLRPQEFKGEIKIVLNRLRKFEATIIEYEEEFLASISAFRGFPAERRQQGTPWHLKKTLIGGDSTKQTRFDNFVEENPELRDSLFNQYKDLAARKEALNLEKGLIQGWQ